MMSDSCCEAKACEEGPVCEEPSVSIDVKRWIKYLRWIGIKIETKKTKLERQQTKIVILFFLP